MDGARTNNRRLQSLCALVLLALFLPGTMLKGWRQREEVAHPKELQREEVAQTKEMNNSRQEEEAVHPKERMRARAARLSHEWLEFYSEDNVGCDLGRGSYTWRLCGFGSNMNNLLDAWLYALVVKEWRDVALVFDPSLLGNISCSIESDGRVAQGWNCLFSDMPHLCTFDTAANWTQHMAASGVSDEEQQEAAELTIQKIRFSGHINSSLKQSGIDRLRAVAVLAQYLWNHMAPWLQDDVSAVTHAHETFQQSPFVGIHIRRGDKISEGEAELIQVADYLSAAVDYLEANNSRTRVDAIRGLWVASDDSAVIGEVRTLAHEYFPGVPSESIVYAGQGMPGGPENTGMVTSTDKQGYGSFVYLFADLYQLAAADVFVGTFSSNIGRLVVVLRENLHKQRTTSISIEGDRWSPGRRQQRTLTD